MPRDLLVMDISYNYTSVPLFLSFPEYITVITSQKSVDGLIILGYAYHCQHRSIFYRKWATKITHSLSSSS